MARDPRTVVREAARVLLFDADDRILLLRGHDPAQPERTWWFTPGGGLDGAEDACHAAARELCEETGYELPADALIGPVWERTALFDFMDTPYVQHEEFFVARVDANGPRMRESWTDGERETLDEQRWFAVEHVRELDIEVFPHALGELLATVRPWDGVLRHLGEEHA